MSDIIISCDPGVHGAIACFVDRELIAVEDLPTILGIKQRSGAAVRDLIGGSAVSKRYSLNAPYLAKLVQTWLGGLSGTMVCEKVSTRPMQGNRSNAQLVETFGLIRGVAAGLDIPFLTVEPEVWKRAMGVTAIKESSRAKVLQLFPQHAARFRLKKNHDRAEAVLIGYCMIKYPHIIQP